MMCIKALFPCREQGFQVFFVVVMPISPDAGFYLSDQPIAQLFIKPGRLESEGVELYPPGPLSSALLLHMGEEPLPLANTPETPLVPLPPAGKEKEKKKAKGKTPAHA